MNTLKSLSFILASSAASAQPIVGDLSVARAIADAHERRVDFVGIGDSNQLFESSGWDEGWQHALGTTFDMYATGLVAPQQNNGNGYGTGYRYAGLTHNQLVTTGAPSELAQFIDDRLGNIHEYGYLDAGSATQTRFTGLNINANCDINPSDTLRFDFHYGTFVDGAGSFQPAIRRGSSPFNRLLTGLTVQTSTGVHGMSTASLRLPAASRPYALQAGYAVPGVADIRAPFFGGYIRATNTGRSTGFSYHTQVYLAGRTLRDMAIRLQNASDTYLNHFYSLVRQEQLSQNPAEPGRVIITINSGLNDRNEDEPSVGPMQIADGDSAAAYADNLNAIIDRIESAWPSTGGSIDELFFLVMPSHPIGEPNSPEEFKMVGYRDAARQVATARPRVLTVDLSRLTDHNSIAAAGYYDGAGRAHLEARGYRDLAELALGHLLFEACPADVNRDFQVDGLDFGAWLAAFNSMDQEADQNRDGRIDGLDFGAWLGNFNSGCD